MFQKSGYGKLEDNIANLNIFNGIYGDIDMLLELSNNTHMYNTCQNIKSKYIEADDYCAPIIGSKSLSLRNIFSNIDYGLDIKELNNLDIAYNYIENNLYPIRNHDLLDATINDKQVELIKHTGKKTIFFDKLIPYSNDPSLPYKSIGPLYTNSPENIPVLTKIINNDINNKNSNDIKIVLDRNKLLDIIEVERICNIDKKSILTNSKYIDMIVIYTIKEHFRSINGSDIIPIDAYIPNTAVILKFPLSSKIINKYINQYITMHKNNGNISGNLPNVSVLDMQMQLILDPILKSYIIYDAYRNSDNKNYRFTSFHYAVKHNSQSISDLRRSNMVRFPFGNVYESNKVCMKDYKMGEWAFDVEHIYNSDFTIDIANVINGSYSDFFDSRFNSDLRTFNFILKSDYIDFLDNYKDSFSDNYQFFSHIYNISKDIKW